MQQEMKITRFGDDRITTTDANRIEIEIGETKYSITNYFGEGIKINVAGEDNSLVVKPCCGNEVVIIGG